MRKHHLLLGLTLALALPAEPEAGRLPARTYPFVYQTMRGRLEPSDFAGMTKYDGVDVGMWALRSDNGYIDSLRALRERNPDQVLLVCVSAMMTCSNWDHDEVYRRSEWGDTVQAHADRWLLRDTDGDLYVMADVESTCNEGRLNFYHHDMARAFARHLAESTVLRYPADLDGIFLDDLQDNVFYMNGWTWLKPPWLDSIDANQDGQADTYQELGQWWSAGVDTFLVTLREQLGPDAIIINNGYVPVGSAHRINGRWHEGYPHEHGDGWEVAMTHRRKGFIGGDTLYSDAPTRFTGLVTSNASAGYNFDPDRLSTKEVPFPHPGLPGFLRFSLASYLLGEGWYAMTGWGNSVDWKGDRIPWSYQTLWWFPVYDTLKTHLGTPTGKAVRDTDEWHRDRFQRDYTGGRTRVFPSLRRGILDLRPAVGLDEPMPASVRAGDTLSIPFSAFDPNGANQHLAVSLRLSRDGGATFPEVVASGGERDSVLRWVPTGSASSCMLQVSAVDTSDLAGTAESSIFRIGLSPAPNGGLAEILPNDWIANMPSLLCTLTVYTPGGAPSSGWDRIAVVFPESVHLLSFAGAEGESGPLASTSHMSGDTLLVDLASRRTSPARVRLRLFVNAPAPTGEDTLAFAAGVNDSQNPGPWVWLDPGDGNGRPGDGNTLSVTCAYGPPVRVTIEPVEMELAAGDTARFALDGSDAAGNAVELAPAWSVSEPLGMIDSTGLFRAAGTGTLQVRATVGDLSAAALVTVVPGGVDSLHVTPKSTSVTIGQTIHYQCSAWDSFGNPIEDPSPAWTLVGPVGTIDGDGVFQALAAGAGTVRAVSGSARDSATVHVLEAPLVGVFVHPAEATVSADSVLACTLYAVSATGETISVAGSWEVRSGGGAIDEEGRYAPDLAGPVVLAGSCSVGTDSASVTVVPGAPAHLLLEPDSAEIAAGETLAVAARLEDADGNTAPGTVLLHAEGACAGPIEAFFMCEAIGEARIVGEHGSLRDTAFVEIAAGPPHSVAVAPGAVEAAVGDTIRFTASSADRFGNPAVASFVWAVVGGIGSIDEDGLFLARETGNGGVVAWSDALADTALLSVADTGDGGTTPSDTTGTDTTVTDTTGTDTTATDTTVVDTTSTDTTATDTTVVDTTAVDTTAAPGSVLTLAAVESAYPAAGWPAPLALQCAFLDTAGEPAWPAPDDTFRVRLRPLGESAASCDSPLVWTRVGELPPILEIPMDRIGGCGLLEMWIEGPGEIASPKGTIPFSSPDANRDLFVDLGDAAALLAAWRGAGENGCADLDGDSAFGAGDLEILAAAWDLGCGPIAAGRAHAAARLEWYQIGDAAVSCEGETTAARFRLDPSGVDSIVALEISFPARGAWDRPVTWVLSSAWKAPLLYELPDGPDGPRVLIVETDGFARPGAGGLLEARICGARTDAFGGGASYARILAADLAAGDLFEAPIRFLLDIDEEPEGPSDTTGGGANGGFALLPNLPNPFTGSTTLRFAAPAAGGMVRLDVYNVRGERVRVLGEEPVGPGSHAVEWNGRDYRGRALPPGVYFVRMEAPGMIDTKKVLLVP